MFKKLFAFLEDDQPRRTNDIESPVVDEEDKGEVDEEEKSEVDEENYAFGINPQENDEGAGQKHEEPHSFLSMIKEKRKIHDEKYDEYQKEIEQFNVSSSERRVEIKLELEEEFEVFFQQANNIVKQTRDQEESKLLEKLGAMEIDDFTGNFSFEHVKAGKTTMNEVSNIFRPRRARTGKHFREDGDDFDVCCQLLTGVHEPPVNYDPLSEWEYNHWQKHYIGLAKTFARHLDNEDLTLDLSQSWVGDVIAMKLLAEFVWRNTEMITGVNANSAKGFHKKNCLMVMQGLKECTGLKTLDFDDTSLCREGSSALALITKVSASLEEVTLANSNTMDAGACFWGLALASGCPSLQSIDLSNAKITASGAIAIAIGLSKHQSLKVLNLSGNRVDRQGCQRLGEALLVNPILEELVLSKSAIGSRGAMSLAAFLIHPRCRLKILDISDNDIGRRGGKALAVAMSINKSLRKLNLRANDLGDPGIAGFGVALERNTTLEELNIGDCDITDLGASAFSMGLAVNSTIVSLDMSSQIIADAGCAEIARHIAANPQCRMVFLNLASNAIRDAGAQGLAMMLESNRSIVDLKLNDNEIGNEGAITLGKILADKQNSTLKTLDVSENPISAEVCMVWFTKAERRMISQHTQRLDVVAQGTQMARGNLRGCGVIVMRSNMQGMYAFTMGAIAIAGGWFDFISDIIVAYNTVMEAIAEPANYTAYASLIVLFVAFPFFYILIVFSLPEDETDVTEAPDGPSTHHMMPQGSSLILGRMTSHTTSGGKSFREHLNKVTRAKCDENRVMLFFINLFQLRVAYEIYLSTKTGLTTLAYSSIRLTEALFEAVPQSIIQIHILLSTDTLLKMQQIGGVFNPEDRTVLLLFVSVGFSISVLSNTLAGLFEEKFVVNWKRVALANEELAYWLGFFAAYFYHASHYLCRSLTITLIASIYHPILAATWFAFGLLLRLGLHRFTKSERLKMFALVSYLVGVASWDKKLASRIAVLLETLETFIVIGPLWVHSDVIEYHLATTQYVFQQNWLSLVDLGGPVLFTALLYSCWGLSCLLYFGFIERIHPYSDVPQVVDVSTAEALAKAPFTEMDENQKRLKEQKLRMIQGKHMLASMGSSMRASANKVSGFFLSPFRGRPKSKGHRRSKAKEGAQPAIAPVVEEENDDDADHKV